MLLKNSGGLLPLSQDLKTIAVIGPNATTPTCCSATTTARPRRPVTVLAGIRAAVSPRRGCSTRGGADLVEGRSDPRAVPAIPSGLPASSSRCHRARPAGRVLQGPRFRLGAGPHARRSDRQLQVGPRIADDRDEAARGGDRGARDCRRRLLGALDRAPRFRRSRAPTSSRCRPTTGSGWRLTAGGAGRVDGDAARPREECPVGPRGRPGHDLRLEYFEADARRGDQAGVADAGGEVPVRRGPRRRARRGRRRVRGRPHRRRRGRGDAGVLPGVRGRRPRGHRPSRHARPAAARGPRDGQAGRARPGQRGRPWPSSGPSGTSPRS